MLKKQNNAVKNAKCLMLIDENIIYIALTVIKYKNEKLPDIMECKI